MRLRGCGNRSGVCWGGMTLDAQHLARMANRCVLWFTRHWLALLNVAVAMILGLALLAPWLSLHGHSRAGQLLYLAYRPLCHQLPERAFFLGGPQAWYSYEELAQTLGVEVPARYIGSAQLGYKMAFCQRDAAIFAGYLSGGLLFALWRRRGWDRPLPWQVLVLATAPMAIDGLAQLFGLVESTPLRRVLTGWLFGVAAVAFVLPWLEKGMTGAHRIAQAGLEESDAGSG